MKRLTAYSDDLILRVFFTAVFGFDSGLASPLPLDSPAAFFATTGRARAGLGLAVVASTGTSGAATTALGSAAFSSTRGGSLGAAFLTFFGIIASSAAGAGGAASWSPFAITSPL